MMPTARSAGPATSPDLLDTLRSSVRDGLPQAIADLSTLVRIPSVSWDGFDPEHVRRSAEHTAQLLRDLGVFESVIVDQAPAPSGVLG